MPRRKLWTVDEYHRLGDKGALEGISTCLVEGEIIEMPAQSETHFAGVTRVQAVIAQAFGPGFWVRAQGPLRLCLSTDPEPDIAVVPGTQADYSDSPTTVLLIVEVSYSTRDFDLNDKARLYATGGIVDYWVADLVERQVIVHRDPQPDASQRFGFGYTSVTAHDASASVQPLAAQSTVRVVDLLP